MPERIYAWLLKFYPRRFRDEYASAALQLFQDRSRVERGGIRRLWFWLDILTDFALSLFREHRRRDSDWEEAEGAFRLSEGAVSRLKKRDLVYAFLLILFIALGMTAGRLGGADPVLFFSVYISLVMFAIWKLISVSRNEQRWRGYRLIIGADRLQQIQHGNDMTIFRNQIIKVNEDEDGLRIWGLRQASQATIAFPLDHLRVRELASSIWVPVGVTGYEQVRAQISEWTNRIGRLRVAWHWDLKSVFLCAASLLPAILLVHSASWLLVIAAVYYGLVLLAMGTDIIGLLQRPSARERRRLLRSCFKPPLLVLLILPIIRMVLPL